MNIKKLLPFCLATIFVLNSCKKGGVTPGTSGPADVYIVGYTTAANGNNVATYWKNDVATKLEDSTSYSVASAITTDGNDIYIAGTVEPGGLGSAETPVYWKNGVRVTLPNVGFGSASSIAVTNGNIYVGGSTTPNAYDDVATYWKNGVQTKLTNGSYSVFVNGVAANSNNVYLCGADSYGGAQYWKNGTNTTLGGGQAFAVTLSDNDVYICGFSGAYAPYYPTVWKNGTATVLNNSGIGEARAITVVGNDVYVAGFTSNGQGDYGISGGNSNVISAIGYWKNGVFTTLPTTGGSSTNAIAVSGNDVYVAGYNAASNSGYTTYTQAVYWKNGTLTTLNQTNSSANGIAIVPE
jgi:uncharacterized membrane protein